MMKLFKSEDEHFFLQWDGVDSHLLALQLIKVEDHSGDEEKHLPMIEKKNHMIKVKIGSIMHPMKNEHHISMIYLKTKQGGQLKILSGLQTPIVYFALLENDEPLEVYGYCNLHGLWKELV